MRAKTAVILGSIASISLLLMSKGKKLRQQIRFPKPTPQVPAATVSTEVSPADKRQPAPAQAYYPKADILLSAGPRKSQRDTELGEDVAGVALTHNRIAFWVLDGTSDSASILNEKGSEILSSRLLALTLGATLHQLAPKHDTTENLLAAAFDNVSNQIQEQVVQQRQQLEQFVATQPAGLHHWQVSTTVLLGMLSIDGAADLMRIGDSKAFCYNENFELLNNPIGNKPAELGLGRLYARITHDAANEKNPFAFSLMPPARPEQMHTVHVADVRRIIAFSDGIGHPTEQYLKLMLGRQDYSHFQVGVARTPNRTFDDKTMVLASFERS